MSSPDDALVDRLAALDSCALSDALDALARPAAGGVLDGLRCLTGVARISGRVLTVELGRPDGSPSLRHLGTAAADAATAGTVIVIAHQGRVDSAGWGGNLSRAAKRNGAAGVICHGAVRDVDEARDVGLALFATAATPRTARGRTVERSWGEPIDLDGQVVATGDYVLADSTGVVFITAAEALAVIERAEAIAGREAAMAAAIEAGTPVSAVMGGDYERMLR